MNPEQFESALAAREIDIQRIRASVDKVSGHLSTIRPPDDIGPGNLHLPYRACKQFLTRLKEVEAALGRIKMQTLEHQINVYWGGNLSKKQDRDDYERKRAVVKEFNADLRSDGYSIRHPESGMPCILLATSSPDGKGRYVLSQKSTKKRTNTCMSLIDLMPFRLVQEPRRREGFIESRWIRDNQPLDSGVDQADGRWGDVE